MTEILHINMSATGVFLYCLANSVWILLFWLFKHPLRPPKKENSGQSVPIRRRKNKVQGRSLSLLESLGITKSDVSFHSFNDHFRTFTEVSDACRKAGLESCGLIIGVDFTASNEWQGRKSFGGNCLHRIIPGRIFNPYQKVISIIGQTLEPFDDDRQIPSYGFGDSTSLGDRVFPFYDNGYICQGFMEVLDRYNEIVPKIMLSGPTNFAPIITEAIDIVIKRKSYHILIIIADGQVNEEEETINAIIRASEYPLSIVMVGVGDGPWDLMEEFDNFLTSRKFDNFQFVNYHQATSKSKHPDATLALHVMMEIPLQYKTIKSMGYLDNPEKQTDV